MASSPAGAVRLAAGAWKISPTSEAEEALRVSLMGSRESSVIKPSSTTHVEGSTAPGVNGAIFSPAGTTVLTIGISLPSAVHRIRSDW